MINSFSALNVAWQQHTTHPRLVWVYVCANQACLVGGNLIWQSIKVSNDSAHKYASLLARCVQTEHNCFMWWHTVTIKSTLHWKTSFSPFRVNTMRFWVVLSGRFLTCVKVLVCIVEAWMCSTTRSTSGLGPVTKPILSLKQNTTSWIIKVRNTLVQTWSQILTSLLNLRRKHSVCDCDWILF